MKRDIQGKFALKNSDYRKVRSLRLTDVTWIKLGIAAECMGMTRADYLEQIVRDDTLPSITREKVDDFPCITRKKEYPGPDHDRMEGAAITLPRIADLEALRAHVLFDLRLGKQASGYKALNRFITELTSSA